MTHVGRDLLLAISGPGPGPEDRRLLAFAESMGVFAHTVVIGIDEPLQPCFSGPIPDRSLCLAMSADTLATVNQHPGFSDNLIKLLDGPLSELLVFGCSSALEHREALLSLTAGAIAGICPLGESPSRFSLSYAATSLSGPPAGLTWTGSHEGPVSVFELHDQATHADVILTADERPVCVRLKRRSAQIFLLTLPLPDVNRPLSPAHGIEKHYAALLPPLIFLRSCFRDRCWHAPQSTARLIIDDPRLSMSYGFLDYQTLQRSMRRFRYGTSIAFIPWNSWRTSRKNASRLLNEDSNLSICIHGCDHTKREFETQDAGILDARAALAMHRMQAQQKRTGAAFEPVMIFPQGRFSVSAINALRTNGYLAAVNTTVFPVDHGATDITIGDLLRPAVTRYNGFPIFSRHYPGNLLDLAFDIFLGKPALIVEHHSFFREGFEAIEAVVDGLYKVAPSLSWPSLSEQLTQSCVQRSMPNGSEEVMFFTRRFQLENRGQSEKFLLSKHEPDPAAVSSVAVDGVTAPWSIDNGMLKFEVKMQPGQVRRIEILDREKPPQRVNNPGIAYKTGVLLRRGLSELRDNALARNERLLKVANGIAKAMKVTGNG